MTPTRLAGFACACALALGAAPPDELVPLGPEQVVNVALGYTQEWVKVALQPDATRFAVAYETVINHDVFVRFYDFDGVPTSGEIQVNLNLTGYIQDEPMVAMDALGNLLVCWSDRNGYDGWQMGCFGQLFDATGTHTGTEFQINLDGASASQWEPMPAALPGGGWVVAFNGDNDGNAYLRYFDTDGTPRTGDIAINTYWNNGQTEAECAVASDGTVLAVYADFGGNVQGGTGTNLLARRFTAAGVVLDPLEFVVNSSSLLYDQLEPRIDVDGANTYVMVWQDGDIDDGLGHDGDGVGIFARRYDTHGTALGVEFQVNEVGLGDQFLPEVSVTDDGRFVVTWEDHATGSGRIMARLFGADAQPMGPSFQVSGDNVGNYRRPQVVIDGAGTRAIFSYHGPGNASDAYVRLFDLVEAGPPEIIDESGVDGARPGLATRPGAGQPGASLQAPPPPALP